MKVNGIIPKNYKNLLDLRETERAIKMIKDFFQINLAGRLNLQRVSAPLFVKSGTGVNDDLSGVEKPVTFKVKALHNEQAEIVQSLAKWKRMALAEYGFAEGEGLYTDMNAIRPDEELDNLHSLYVDQWDWEKIISRDERNLDYLIKTVKQIYSVIKEAEDRIFAQYPALEPTLPQDITFIHSEELEELYPQLTPKEREDAICREKGAVFLIGIGADLKSGQPHDGRAPDYDDWSTPTTDGKKGLNGDILVWNPVLKRAVELSSMGIRVDKEALLRQLQITGEEKRLTYSFHQKLLHDQLPLSIGGGIGQSRLCMLLLKKAHVGEVQVSIWPEEMIEEYRKNNIFFL
ncbi:MAG TPA: aspartate--ammonia ligase [Firmicutes bacterium]|nr:aspartate--ammonia ligase [Bacillota bacterium]